MKTHSHFVLLLAGLAGSCVAFAQLSDPTRPATDAGVTESASGIAAPVESGVQTVILRPGGKSAAVINGKYVEVGGKVGDQRVLKITESAVVLQGVSGREVMKVMPAVEKVPARKSPAADKRTKGITEK